MKVIAVESGEDGVPTIGDNGARYPLGVEGRESGGWRILIGGI